jgi:hypothetical protein
VNKFLRIAGAVALLSAPVMAAPPIPFQSDLDDFMKKVVAQRDENWKKLQQYILDEKEQVEVRGPSKAPIWGDKREYSWFIKEGFFIRSPTKVNGVAVPEADRRKAEDEYLNRAKERDKRRARGETQVEQGDPQAPESLDGLLKQSRRPEFVESAYFLRFKFEEGKYALVGREKFENQDVLRIEYYPARLFSHEQDKQARQAQRGQQPPPAGSKTQVKKVDPREQEMDAIMEKMMNKVSLVTIWVQPTSHQIVKYTFDNVNFDFLPAAWLVRVSDLKASMTMSQAFKDVWLPRDIDFYAAAMLATGAFDVRYHLDYHDYREATAGMRIRGGGGQ